jgi:hypothetical protein
MTCARTATIATDPETYTNQRLRCDSALPPDYHAECHSPFCHAALTSTRVDAPKSVAIVAVLRDDCHNCHRHQDQRCAAAWRRLGGKGVGWGAAETPRPGPARGMKVCGGPARNFFSAAVLL